ncbi:MAG: hypothetical protein ACREH5_01125 [Candidatus Omnitrophota bacterium]
MKQYKISLLVLVGLTFAGMIGVKRYLDTRPVPPPASNPPVNRQMAVETMPAPVTAPKPQMAAAAGRIAAAEVPVAKTGGEVLSYIQFLELPENYPVLSQEISWREYRQYRRKLRRAPETAPQTA